MLKLYNALVIHLNIHWTRGNHFVYTTYRYSKLLLYMGLPVHQAKDTKINYFCKIISEFALEFRTTREKVLQQMLKKEKQRERKKTRGKMIMDVSTCFCSLFFYDEGDVVHLNFQTSVIGTKGCLSCLTI